MLEPPSEQLRQRAKHAVNSTSQWDDDMWTWDEGSPGTGKTRRSIRWNVAMADGTRFTEPQWKPWAETTKIAMWSLVADPPEGRKPMRGVSLKGTYFAMRILVQWMHDNGYKRLNQLTREGQRAFMRDVKQRKGKGKRGEQGKRIGISTLAHYQNVLRLLFLQGRRYPELAIGEPAPQDAIRVSTRREDSEAIPRTPEPIAIALIAGAIHLLGEPAEDIIEARHQTLDLYKGIQGTVGTDKALRCTRKELKTKPLSWERCRNEPWYKDIGSRTLGVRELTRRVCDAAFVVLSYLVGLRVSEILALETGCITKRPSLAGDETFTFVTGKIYKTAPTAAGETHEWVAPPIAERAIEVLERVSAPLRKETGSPNLWQYRRREGTYGGGAKIDVLKAPWVGKRLNRLFAPLIGVPTHNGEPWHLSPHQGRKTFAYFVAKQDRSGLHALQKHLGHRSIVMTDHAYSGHDHEMRTLIGEAGMDEMVEAFAEVLTATELAGKGGEEIINRSPFRGEVINEDMLEYARQRLQDTGQRLEVCDYGYCYYNARHAACHGDEHGPNHAVRTQSVCVECKNFVVGPKHIGVWQERRRSYQAVLAQTEMARETKSAVRAKVAECEGVIQSLKGHATVQ